ncbi:hypothetical protein ES702_02968 [subsurface metagenome]
MNLRNDIELTDKDKEYLIKEGFPKEKVNKMNYRSLLVMKGYSASEIDAKIHSIYTQKIFRAPRMTLTNIVIMVLLMLSSCLITYMVTSVSYQSIINGME